MNISRLIAGSLLALSATGCLATKGDIRLLQDELRAARASAVRSDSLQKKTADSLRLALENLARVQANNSRDAAQSQQRLTDSLRSLTAIVRNADIATREKFKSIDEDIIQLREIARQNSRRIIPDPPRPVDQPARDTTAGAAPPASSGAPSAGALLQSGRTQIIQGSCSAARRAFQEILTMYPDSPEAAEALFSTAESFVACPNGNPAQADSVHKLVVERYPRSDFAPMSLYKRAEMLRTSGRMNEARPLYERILCLYGKSDPAPLALDRLGGRRPASC